MQNLYLNKLDKSTFEIRKSTKKQLHTYWFISFTGWWYAYPSEKYESSSVGMIIPFPIYGKS